MSLQGVHMEISHHPNWPMIMKSAPSWLPQDPVWPIMLTLCWRSSIINNRLFHQASLSLSLMSLTKGYPKCWLNSHDLHQFYTRQQSTRTPNGLSLLHLTHFLILLIFFGYGSWSDSLFGFKLSSSSTDSQAQVVTRCSARALIACLHSKEFGLWFPGSYSFMMGGLCL